MAEARGYDMGGLRARQVSRGDFENFNLILGLDKGHIQKLERLRPEGSKAKIALLMEHGTVSPPEVPDPWSGGEREYGYSLDLIESAMPGLISSIRAALN